MTATELPVSLSKHKHHGARTVSVTMLTSCCTHAGRADFLELEAEWTHLLPVSTWDFRWTWSQSVFSLLEAAGLGWGHVGVTFHGK